MVIRKAINKDIDRLKLLFDDLHRFSFEQLPHFFQITQTSDDYINKKFEKENCEIFVADVDDKVVGFIEVHLNTIKDIPEVVSSQYVFIQRIIIDSDYRKKGIGKKLMNAAKDWAKELNIDSIRLSVISINENAIDFYKSLGYKDMMNRMELRLS